MKKLSILLGLFILLISGCANVENEGKKDEKFFSGITLDDGRIVHATFSVKYENNFLFDLLSDNTLKVEDFLAKLELVSTLNDGGSKLYKYNKDMSFSGIGEYYVLNCNSVDSVKDIFIAQDEKNLGDLCSIHYDDLDGITMEIKEGTLSNKGLSVVITDLSDRDNIYGVDYFVEKYQDSSWKKLDSKIDMVFNSVGLKKNENNVLEFDINWLSYYGRLKPGKYRLVKNTTTTGEGIKHFLTVEFNIK